MLFLKIARQSLVGFFLLLAMPIYTQNVDFFNEKDTQQWEQVSRDGSLCNKLCISKVLAKCLKARHIKSENLDSDNISSQSLCSDSINTNRLCANMISVNQQLCAPSFNAPIVCAENLTAANICCSGMMTANAFEQCGRFRATMVFSVDTSYTLGTLVPFDFATDDPNGDISFGPSTYTAPRSGYYTATVQLDTQDLVGTNPALGVPVGNVEILVNGKSFRQAFSPFLTFHNAQNSTYSFLISLKAGDKVTMLFNIYVMDDTAGFIPYVGSITILGNGTEEDRSMFKIHYLSSDCTEVPCQPCQSTCTPTPCALPCFSCTDCHNMNCCDE